jgi:hypothetical protein
MGSVLRLPGRTTHSSTAGFLIQNATSAVVFKSGAQEIGESELNRFPQVNETLPQKSFVSLARLLSTLPKTLLRQPNRVSACSAFSGFDFQSLMSSLRLPQRLCVSAVRKPPYP